MTDGSTGPPPGDRRGDETPGDRAESDLSAIVGQPVGPWGHGIW